VRRTLIGISFVAFFALADVGLASGCSPWTCAMKASVGAAAVYVLLTVAWRLAVNVLVSAVIESSTKQEGAAIRERGNQPRE
jgi:mannitol-specific phosphotransferase system IIBC component